jgi:proteasome accessory factor B
MLRIHELVAAGQFPNGRTMAAEFAISIKTVKRDFQFMRDHFDLPIEYDRHRHGYFYSSPVDKFPGTPSMTEAEMFALLVAHKAIAQYHGTPFHQPLKMAFQKLTGQLDKSERYTLNNLHDALSFRPLAPEDADLQTFQTITRALQERRALKFHYRKPGQECADLRQVHPYHMTCSDNRWYILAHDPGRGDVRTFALGRIQSAVLTDHRFSKPASFDPQKYLGASFGVMKGDGDYEVVLEFDAWATDLLRGRQWHPTQTVRELPGGGCHMGMRLSGLDEIERWILSWGTHANVLRPASLAARLHEIALTLVHRYQATPVASVAEMPLAHHVGEGGPQGRVRAARPGEVCPQIYQTILLAHDYFWSAGQR